MTTTPPVTPPTVTPVTVSVPATIFRGSQDVQPFTYRSGMTYTALLESIRAWLYNTLVPYLNTNFGDLETSWMDNITAIDDAVNTALSSQAAAINTALTTQQQQVADELATTLNQITSGESAALNDAAVSNALQVANSQSLAFLDPRYAVTDARVAAALETPGSVSVTFLDGHADARYVVAPAPSGADDTAALTTWFASLSGHRIGRISGAYTISGQFTIPDDATVDARGAVFTCTTATAYDVIHLGNNSVLHGLEIAGGTKAGGNGVVVASVTGAVVADCYIHDLAGTSLNDGRGIAVISTSSKYKVIGNRINNVHAQGIDLDTSSSGTVTGNSVDTALHGIQFWGGDSSVSSIIGIAHLVIANNRIKNVTGGIWGSLGQYVTITGNDVDTCTDVGIDFEGCLDSAVTGNTVRNAKNGAYAVFYASSRCVFSGNVADQTTAGNGPGFKFFATAPGANTRITVRGNIFTGVANGVTNDAASGSAASVTDSLIADNDIRVLTDSVAAVLIRDANRVRILDNTMHVTGHVGIDYQGVSDGEVEGNKIYTDAGTDTTAVGASAAGIHLYWRNATFPGKRNRIRNNTVAGFVQAIFDNCWGDNASYNLIENNVATPVNHKGTTGYTGVINNNRTDTTHAAATVAAV
jgi:parallel beta-helix repeat protein